MSRIKVNSHGDWVYTIEEIADALRADVEELRLVAGNFYHPLTENYTIEDVRVIVRAYRSMSEENNTKRLHYLSRMINSEWMRSDK